MKLIPPPATSFAEKVDTLAIAYFSVATVLVLAVLVALVYFSIKYSKNSPASRENRPKILRKQEAAVILLILLIGLTHFFFAGRLFYRAAVPPKDSLTFYVVAKQWMWIFYPPGGEENIGEITVPVGKPVHLVMTSADVIHSLFIPAFRIKQDILPGRYTSLWFKAERVGTFQTLCTQYCGASHSQMRAVVNVIPQEDYEKKAANFSFQKTLAGEGAALYNAKSCVVCHSTAQAPHFSDLYNSAVLLENGNVVTADEDYLRRSILFPKKEVVRGYQPIMPPFKGLLSEHEVLALIAYIKSQKEVKPHGP